MISQRKRSSVHGIRKVVSAEYQGGCEGEHGIARAGAGLWRSARLVGALVLALASGITAAAASANDLVLTNARIVVGNGQVIERGTVVVVDGRISAVSSGPAPAGAKGERYDATGMTVIAGYIDCHRHLIPAGRPGFAKTPQEFLEHDAAAQMLELLESGVTTVQSGGDDNPSILKLKAMVESGQIKGPRIISSAWVMTARMKDEAEVRAAVDAAKASGTDSIAEVAYPALASMTVDTQYPFHPSDLETQNLRAGLDEAKKLGIPFQIHAVSPEAQVAAVRLGGRRLIHSSHYTFMTDAQAQEIAASGAMVASSNSVPSPVFNVFNHDDKPTYRDGAPWPKGSPAGEDRGQAVGKFPVNSRTLFDNGVTFAYSSDTNYNATIGLGQELKILNLVFSPIDLVKIMGPNSAAFVEHSADRGTVEAGKLADLLVLTGNPLDGYWNFLKPVIVIKGGELVVDQRSKLRNVKTF